MQEVGEVLHIAKSGRLIVKLTDSQTKLNPGDMIVDSKGRKIAKVVELIGPVEAPYASAIPVTSRASSFVGTKVFKGGKRKK